MNPMTAQYMAYRTGQTAHCAKVNDMTQKIQYGLRDKKTGKMVTFHTQSNDHDCESVSVSHFISFSEWNPWWLVRIPERAEYVRTHTTAWYNADHDQPAHEYDFTKHADDCEVVKVVTTVETTPMDIKLPTTEELIELKYREKEPGHADYLQKLIKEGENIDFHFFDYAEALKLWEKYGDKMCQEEL
jgi:hypothetical protein